MDAAYSFVIKKIYEQVNRDHKWSVIVDVQMANFNERARNSKRFYVVPAENKVF
jgi:hypothetical protein